jgi:hypothetical protein
MRNPFSLIATAALAGLVLLPVASQTSALAGECGRQCTAWTCTAPTTQTRTCNDKLLYKNACRSTRTTTETRAALSCSNSRLSPINKVLQTRPTPGGATPRVIAR